MDQALMIDDLVEIEEPPAQPAASIWSPRLRWLTIGLVLTVVGAAFEALAVGTILPTTVRDLGGIQLYGWVFSAFLLANLVGITIAGAEADRLGPAGPFLAGVGLFVAGLLGAGLAPSMLVLIVARAVQGAGGGFIGSIAYIAIARGYPAALKPRMLAVMSTAWVVPGLVGPAVAGAVAEYVGWRWVFLGLAPVMLVAAGLAMRGLRGLGGGTGAPRSWSRPASAITLAVGTGLLMSGLQAQRLPLAAGLVTGGLLVGIPALRRLLPAGTLRAAAGTPAAVLDSGLLNMAFFGVDAFVPLGLTAVRGQSVTRAGLVLTAATLTWTTGAWIQARLAAHGSRRRIATVGLTILAAGAAASAAMLLPTVPVWLAPLAWGIAGLGMGLAYSTLSLVILETAPAGQEGAATSAMQIMNVLGSALGAGVGGVLVAHATAGGRGPGSGIVRQDLLMLVVVAIGVLVAQRLPGRPSTQAQVEIVR